MQSIEDKILVKIKKCGRGKEFFASDFSTYGESKSVEPEAYKAQNTSCMAF